MHAIHGNGAGELARTLKRNAALTVLKTTVEEHADSTCIPMETNGGGACSVHAVFGSPTEEPDGTWELKSNGARPMIGDLLKGGLYNVKQRLDGGLFLQHSRSSLWTEFFAPGMGQGAASESRSFVEHLQRCSTSIFEEASAVLALSHAGFA